MRYIHTKCGGEIHTSKRRCMKCGKKWNILSFWLNPKDIRPDMGRPTTRQQVRKIRKGTSYAKWGDAVPGVPTIASRLPNWPRWARVLASVGVLLVITLAIWVLTGGTV